MTPELKAISLYSEFSSLSDSHQMTSDFLLADVNQ